MANPVFYRAADMNSLRWNAVDVTTNDSTDLPTLAAVITCRADGDIKVTAAGGGVVTLYGVAGMVLPVLVDRVWATGTTATGIVALYGA